MQETTFMHNHTEVRASQHTHAHVWARDATAGRYVRAFTDADYMLDFATMSVAAERTCIRSAPLRRTAGGHAAPHRTAPHRTLH